MKIRLPVDKASFKNVWFWFISIILVCVGIGIGLAAVMLFQIFFGDDSYLKKSTIMAKINEETAIFFSDEETRIGSFFDEHYRRYVPIEEIPDDMINAIVASEDKYFYEHSGVNPLAIFKAFGEGLRSGHFRGGSTITQQTVKNILDRREYSLKRKFKEAIAAIQMERMYNKKQILEFYLNQFHVAANGNGVGIAARYYFNKDVRDLNLVECAFIAGSVKGPSKYNPFIKFTAEEKAKAQVFAHQRKNYVLERMWEQNWINEESYKVAVETPVPFSRGKFRTREVALVTLVKNQLNKKEILEALNLDSISDINNAGLKIFTTLDSELQESAQFVMRKNLSRLETILQGFKPEDPEEFKPLRDLEISEFYFAKVTDVIKQEGKQEIHLDFGLPKGVIPYESLVRYSKLLDISSPIGWKKHLTNLVSKIKPDDVLFIEVRDYDEANHHAIVELHKRPIVSGGLIALDKGDVVSVVSGFYPEGYNRAITATRQPGSVFKSVVYFAALQLGWSMLDPLDNERRMFPYQGQFYYPRPDHPSPYKTVSMLWSGAKSENIAAVYLASRLLDKLNFEQFKGILGMMGLLPEDNESKRDYHYRVARKVGVQLDNEGLKEYQLQNAISDISPDLIFAGQQTLLRRLQKMWWGKGYAAEVQRLSIFDETAEISEDEMLLRIDLVKNNYLRHTHLAAQLREDWNRISQKMYEIGAEGLLNDPEYSQLLARFRVLASRNNTPSLGYFKTFDGETPRKTTSNTEKIIFETTPGRALNTLDVQAIWGEGGIFSSNAGIEIDQVRINGYLPLNILQKIQRKLDERYSAIMAIESPYDLPRYFQHHDFRTALGLEYLVRLCKAMGIYSKMEPVLSFPLGTNVITLAEVAKIYQTFIDGVTYKFYKEGPDNQLNFIKRIEDRFGNILFEPQRIVHELAKPEFTLQMRQILSKVVTHGTGRRARNELYMRLTGNSQKPLGIRIPSFGKTGTTNDYTNASYAGFIPYPVQKKAPLNPSNSYVIASYVGYDTNKQMRKGGFRVTGSQGALPPWTDFGKAIIEKKNYSDYIDKLDLTILSQKEWAVQPDKGTVPMKVDLARGVILRAANTQDVENFATTDYNVTGEDFIDEFAVDTSAASVVRLPQNNAEGLYASYFRMVSPFTADTSQEDAVKSAKISQDLMNIPSRVDPNAAGQFILQDGRKPVEDAQDQSSQMYEYYQNRNQQNTNSGQRAQTQTEYDDTDEQEDLSGSSTTTEYNADELW